MVGAAAVAGVGVLGGLTVELGAEAMLARGVDMGHNPDSVHRKRHTSRSNQRNRNIRG